MIRSDQPLVERMTLIWHDWLATTNADVNNRPLMRAQNELFRRHALGSFADLIADVTIDPAMLVFLSGIDNHRWAPNENYARELMELFTLGADRGAYTETDVRSLARALTGWRADWNDAVGFVNFRFDANRHDATSKTLWAGTAYERSGHVRLARRLHARPREPVSPLALRPEAVVVLHPQPARARARRRRSSRSTSPAATRSARSSRRSCCTPTSTRARRSSSRRSSTSRGCCARPGRRSRTTPGSGSRRWPASSCSIRPTCRAGTTARGWTRRRRTGAGTSPTTRSCRSSRRPPPTPARPRPAPQALAAAIDAAGRPALTAETYAALLAFAEQPAPVGMGVNDFRALRQNALRQLVAASPDAQLS